MKCLTCNNNFEPRVKFCSTKCRVYHSRGKHIELLGAMIKIPEDKAANGFCKVHGIALDWRGRCLQKGCKYA